MTTQEHLNKILEKCRAFLEIAGKRTPGEWQAEAHNAYNVSYIIRGGAAKNQIVQCFNWQDRGKDINSKNNAAFIAACAGPAEAMARSTIAAVGVLLWHWQYSLSLNYEMLQMQAAIIAAWPEETL